MPRSDESGRRVKPWIKYFATAIVSLVGVLVVCLTQNLFQQTELSEIYRVLCNAFFIVGIIMACFGLLTFTSAAGTFDIISYGFKSMKRVRRKYAEDPSVPKTYYDYKESVKGKRRTSWFLVYIGLALVAVAAVFMMLHSNVTPTA